MPVAGNGNAAGPESSPAVRPQFAHPTRPEQAVRFTARAAAGDLS
ncbi:hypothetical protein FRUB_08656 [Fimbriiglobus ruber]|uniref:Uncharacterized protein n=1 Tax=Fimbriiglobus ruber TaxID=1908690 RepID=A0A225D563_9BACT|nr:hypothetical protein FRUB_08656 [Fimbriiglobus ruber]